MRKCLSLTRGGLSSTRALIRKLASLTGSTIHERIPINPVVLNLPVQVHILADKPSICTAYARLVRSEKMQSRTFDSVEEFMRTDLPDENKCVISDLRMSGTSGLELPALLARAGRHRPVIFETAHDRDCARHARNARPGAASWCCRLFRKPVDDQTLLDAVAWALGKGPGNLRS